MSQDVVRKIQKVFQVKHCVETGPTLKYKTLMFQERLREIQRCSFQTCFSLSTPSRWIQNFSHTQSSTASPKTTSCFILFCLWNHFWWPRVFCNCVVSDVKGSSDLVLPSVIPRLGRASCKSLTHSRRLESNIFLLGRPLARQLAFAFWTQNHWWWIMMKLTFKARRWTGRKVPDSSSRSTISRRPTEISRTTATTIKPTILTLLPTLSRYWPTASMCFDTSDRFAW